MRPPRPSFLATAPAWLLALACWAPSPAPAGPQVAAEPPRLIEQPRADYQARRKELMKRIKEAESGRDREVLVVVRGHDDRLREDFEEGRFRQSNAFAYLTGVEAPGAGLILWPNEGRETLYLPPADPRGGPPLGPSGRTEPTDAGSLGFDKVESTGRFLGDLFGSLGDPMRRSFRRPGSRRAVVYLLSPNPSGEPRGIDDRFTRFLREGAPNTEYKDLAPLLAELRKAKSAGEIALLRKAIAITGDAQAEVVKSIRPGLYEFQLEGKILAAFLQGGAMRPGFASIVGSGPNSTIPHYFLSARRLEDGDLVVVDIGAEYKYYTADITRTYPASGKFTPRQREIYQLVLDAQAEAARRVKPGETKLAEMTGWVRQYLRQSPLRAKDDSGEERTMDRFFIHGLSHYLGMDVHDVGDIQKPMQPGEVFTIEPGIYIKSESLGVRIEDDYLMTEQGVEKLSKDIPSDPDEIERLIARARESRPGTATANGDGKAP
jgi:Xaa-Pro aminopeptidase